MTRNYDRAAQGSETTPYHVRQAEGLDQYRRGAAEAVVTARVVPLSPDRRGRLVGKVRTTASKKEDRERKRQEARARARRSPEKRAKRLKALEPRLQEARERQRQRADEIARQDEARQRRRDIALRVQRKEQEDR
jgi:hypothetical protein